MAKAINPLRMTPETVRVAGHRGHSAGAPENTLAAFRKAHEIVGEGIVTCETDLALTRDGELILIHDETVDRTTDGHGLVRDMTYSEIAKLDAGRWFDKAFAGEQVPLLRDALLLARELGGIIYQLELKVYDKNDEIFSKLRALIIDELDCADLLQFSSFDFFQLRAVKEFIPEVPTVGISHSRLIDPAAVAREANVDAMNLEIQHFPSGEARQLHREGFAVCLYVPHPKQLEGLQSYGVDVEDQVAGWIREGLLDQILSDDVAQMTRVMNKTHKHTEATTTTTTPTLHVIRHAEGFHNLNIANLHMPDPLLTEYGQQQCQLLHDSFPNMFSIDLIVASPLKRTIYTALLSLKSVIATKNLVILAVPELQETSDMPSDTGSDLAELQREFAGQPVDFSLVAAQPGWNSKKGQWAPWKYPTSARAQKARQWLRGRKERNIAVFTHGGFLPYFTEDFSGHETFNHEAFESKMTAATPMSVDERIQTWMTEYPATRWANTEYHSYSFDPESGDGASLTETHESLRRHSII